jgi:hypothetical protein
MMENMASTGQRGKNQEPEPDVSQVKHSHKQAATSVSVHR